MSITAVFIFATLACLSIILYAFVLEFVLVPNRKPWRWERRGTERRDRDRRRAGFSASHDGPERRLDDRRLLERRAVAPSPVRA